ncbi:MAG: hypothetical protein M1825_002299 [Sarcosagium campestre]|nr:MAG: hypothetical protein M1825_002299 [Sarcosagium campestre]
MHAITRMSRTRSKQAAADGPSSPSHTKSPDDEARSSSLSEIEDGDDLEVAKSPSVPPAAHTDSDAETERLENTPHKQRQHQDYLLSSTAKSNIENDSSTLAAQLVQKVIGLQVQVPSPLPNGVSPDNDVASAALDAPEPSVHPDAGLNALPLDGNLKAQDLASASTNRKRKRPLSNNATEDADADEPSRKRASSTKSTTNGDNTHSPIDQDVEMSVELPPENESTSPGSEQAAALQGPGGANAAEEEEESRDAGGQIRRSAKSHRGRKGRRKGKKVPQNEESPTRALGDGSPDKTPNPQGAPAEGAEEAQAEGGAEAEVEAEAEDEEAEAELAAKNEEEVARKRAAIDTLGAIEGNFVAFRDKLYDDRLRQVELEEASLQGPTPSHPEYGAMGLAIDLYRDRKVEGERVSAHYKRAALKRQTLAERAQIHAQYFQAVRDAREKILEEMSREWYQIQRDRRGWGGGVSEYAQIFPTRRSQQIRHQTAYNLEVSILSGVAKHVGFPAAPPIKGTAAGDIEKDMLSMGIKLAPARATPGGPTAAGRRTGAEEQFLEQTPWANPRHPAHRAGPLKSKGQHHPFE